MPEYLTPGVYIEEFEIGAKPIEGVSTSTAGFLGETERGPTYPQLVTSFPEYQRLFGGFFKGAAGEEKYLPYAVDGFFLNGGKRVFVARIVDREGALSAEATVGGVNIKAVGEGTWGNRVRFWIKESSSKIGFRLQVHYWIQANMPATPVDPFSSSEQIAADQTLKDALRKQPTPQLSEDFDDLVLDERSPNFIEKRVASGLSNLVELTKVGAAAPAPNPSPQPLENGSDGTTPITLGDYQGRLEPVPANKQKRSGLAAFDEPPFEEIAILYSPDAFGGGVGGLVEELITRCENNKYRFAVLDSPSGLAQMGTIDPRSGLVPPGGRATQYAAFYYPWIRVLDAETGARKFVPPGGHVIGIYARTDIERGVFKAPANEIVRGALELEFEVTDNSQGVLNPRGVNAIRAFPGRGRRVWGARTLSDNTLWKYVNVRRLFIFIEASIFRGTQWVVFEPNNDRLWGRVKQTITEFLRTQWRLGALFGATEEEAFFVRVDSSTMTDDDINNGRLIVVIGIAPTRPAEFVIFRIAQLTASATSVQL
jgi:phage tail sheath protein FI